MGESFLRTWEDTDAPVLTASNGSFTNLLQAVLVDGYGSTPGLGWTEYFSGTSKKVFKNEGTETLVRFDHSQEANRVYVRGYESMTDVDNGVLPCPAIDFNENYILLKTAANEPANVVPWRILGDDKGIWIWVCPKYADENGYGTVATGQWKMYYVGDYIPFDLTNIHHNFCWAQAGATTSHSVAYRDQWQVGGWGYISDRIWIRRSETMAPGSAPVGLSSGSQYEQGYLGSSHEICTPDSPVQATSIPTIHTATVLMGRLPGLKNSLTAKGYQGAALSPNTYAYVEAVKPEMTFDQGDYKEHFWRLGHAASEPVYVVMTEGKGFRNVI